MSAATKRTPMVIYLNAFMCICVVLVHVTSETIARSDPETLTYAMVNTLNRLLSIGTRGFIMLSAFKLTLKYSKTPFHMGKFSLDRIRRIVIPYVIWVVIYYLYFCWSPSYANTFSWGDLLRHIYIGDIVSPFYFIIIIVQFYVLMPLWRKMVEKIHPIFAITAAVFITIICQYMVDVPYYDRFFTTYLYYWVVGCYIGANFNSFQKILRQNQVFLIVLAVLVGLYNGYLRFSEPYSVFSDLVHIFYCTLMHMSLLAIFSHLKSVPRLVAIINRCSYGIFFIHCLFIYIINQFMDDQWIMRISQRLAIRTVFVLVLSVLSCYLYVKCREWVGKKLAQRKAA